MSIEASSVVVYQAIVVGIQELFDSDRYKAYLTTMAKFHNYSFNNTLLIAIVVR